MKNSTLFKKGLILFLFFSLLSIIPAASANPEVRHTPAEQERLLSEVLDEISERYQVFFNYDIELVKGVRVNIEIAEAESLDLVLKRVLSATDLAYEVTNEKYVIIFRKTRKGIRKARKIQKKIRQIERLERGGPSVQTNSKSPVRQLQNASRAVDKFYREITVSGLVTGEDGEPLIGVNVVEKGTANGTVTDISGRFSLNVENQEAVLQFSYIGYQPKEVRVGSQTNFEVQLLPDVQSLAEIVVIGYGTQQKSDVTGSVVRISTEKTSDLPNFTVLQSIQGQIPGVNIASPERPGQDPQLRIRGNNSLTASNNPLIVVDGIIYNGSISDFNANDIATIDVLKDASAAAVYGSRAANGVLLITTKRGTTEKPTFHFNTYVGIEEPERLIDVLDGPGYVQKISDYNDILLANDPNSSLIELTNIERENQQQGRETDWIDRSLRQGMINNYHLNVSGRSDRTNYYIAGAYFKQDGIVVNDNFERITLNLNLTNDITDWYSITVKSAFSAKDYSGLEASLDQAYRQSPYGNFFDEDGPGGYAFLPIGDQLGEHPLIRTIIDDVDRRNSFWGLLSSQLEVPFVPGLKWTMNYSSNVRSNRGYRFLDNESTVNGQLQNGIANKRDQRFYDWTFDNILNYNRVFSDRHALDVTLLLSREYRNFDVTFAQGSNFVSQALGYNNLGLGEVQEVSSNFEEQSAIAQMARLNYSFDQRYAITFTVRRDGFSAFAANNKYATFPAAAFAWTITNEGFMQDVSWLDYLKLRLSYGQNGNQGINRYSSLARIGTDQYLFGNGGGTIATFAVSSLANNDLTWETTTARNIGLDFEILDRRISGSIDAYLSNTTDLLQSRSLPRITGFGSVITNIGEVENRGVELSLNTNNVVTPDFDWRSGVVFALNRNKIVTLGGLDADGDGIEDDDISNGWFIGEPFDAIFGFQTDGIYQLGDEIPSGYRPGDFRIVDVNGDGTISPADRTILGNRSPSFRLSLSNTVRFKQFSLYTLINAVQGGNGFYLGDNFETRSVNRRGFTTFSERFNLQDVPYWTPNNPTNDYPRLDYSAPYDHPILENRSFIRIQDISIAYNFSADLLKRLKLRNLKIYASVKNLYTFTKWSGYNPESQSTIRDLPFLRNYTFGIDFGF